VGERKDRTNLTAIEHQKRNREARKLRKKLGTAVEEAASARERRLKARREKPRGRIGMMTMALAGNNNDDDDDTHQQRNSSIPTRRFSPFPDASIYPLLDYSFN
jgi:septal ring factor EnvC (AmiA/AmiB activator)